MSTNCFAFLPEEIELMIYKYEHQIKMLPVLRDILSLRNCDDCGNYHVNKHNCYECGAYLCEECDIRDKDDFLVLCEECKEREDMQTIEAEELADYYEFMFGDF